MRRRKPASLAVASALWVSGCLAGAPIRTGQMHELGSALTKLSAAVEATARYEQLPDGLSDQELLEWATRHDPGLLAPFKGYVLRVARDGRNTIVLVCTLDGRLGLLEDAGCTAPMDKHLWQASPPATCEFTIRVAVTCGD